jgi:hypothetical protein
MNDFWASGFFPWGGSPMECLRWLPVQAGTVVDLLLFPEPAEQLPGWILIGCFLVLAAWGAVALIRCSPDTAPFILCAPVVAMGLAVVGVLPLEERTALYTAPFLLLLAFVGVESLADRWGSQVSAVAGWLFAIACSLPVLFSPPPWTHQQVRPVLTEIVQRMEEGDQVYAFYGAGQAFAWYGPRLGLSNWVQGHCHRGDVRGYFRELDALRGQSAWIVFTHARGAFDEVEPMLAYLRAIGTQTAMIEDPDDNRGAAAALAYRFDLSDPLRQGTTTAETFGETGTFRGDPKALCTGPAALF